MKQEQKTIYLDNAATTPLDKTVFEAMLPYLKNTYGNPSSMHHKGREASFVLQEMRERTATVLDVQPEEIIFTGSGTEANNLALFGVARARRNRGKHVLLSTIEHASILSVGQVLTDEGFDVEYIPVNADGLVEVEDVLSRVRPDTILISVMYANNEIGTIQPIQELGEALKKMFSEQSRPLLHTDACQATGQITVAPTELMVDLMTLNSSKIYGPKGVGLLYVQEGITIASHIVGGQHEFGKRAGTENIAGIVGFTHALEKAIQNTEETAKKLTTLRDDFISALRTALPSMILNGHPTKRLPNNIHISFPFIEGESLVLLLDTYGICASTGSACSAHDLIPSHVLRALNHDPNLLHGSLRLTLGNETTVADLNTTVIALKASVERLCALSPLPLHI